MHQISGNIGIYGERLAVLLGFATLISVATVFISCRSFVRFQKRVFSKNLLNNKTYKSFYKYHSYYWGVFYVIIFLHILTALIHTEIPAPNDPDAGIHWIILASAFGSLIFLGAVVFSSCRSFAGMLSFFKGSDSLTIKAYNNFYHSHSYYWWIFIVVVLGHMVSAYIHTGIWPGTR